jgi:hypothetical protein
MDDAVLEATTVTRPQRASGRPGIQIAELSSKDAGPVDITKTQACCYHRRAQRRTPVAIKPIDIKLNKEINAALADPKMKAGIGDLGYTAFSSSPGDFAKFIPKETEKCAKVVKFAGQRPWPPGWAKSRRQPLPPPFRRRRQSV